MKKIFSIIVLIFISLSGFSKDIYSKGQRTESNHYVKKFNVTASNIDYVLSTPYVDTSFKIYDYAGIFTESQRREIQQRCHEFVNKTGLDIAIVTVNGVDHPSYEQYSPQETLIQDFYDYNDFKPDGVMLLLNLDPMVSSHHSIFDAGKLFEQNFIGSKLEYYGPEMKGYFSQGDYFNDVMYYVENVESDYLYDISFPFWKCSGFALLFALLFLGIHRTKYKLRLKATSANNYRKQGSFALTQNQTNFVRTFTTKTYSPRNTGGSSSSGSGSSGGGHSGGSF